MTFTMEKLVNIYNEIAEIASMLHQNGWAEKNAGNFSIKIELERAKSLNNKIDLNLSYPKLANLIFIVTGKGTRMRDISKFPEKNMVIIQICENGNSYAILSDNDNIPTSELPTHLGIHNMIAKRGSNERAIIHSHVTELIALTHIKKFCNQENLNSLFWQMHPETIMFIPKGVGFVPFSLPGSAEIASTTVETLKHHQITIWEKHGVFSIANNLNNCYDLIDIVTKSAKIYFLCASTGVLPEGLSNKQLNDLSNI